MKIEVSQDEVKEAIKHWVRRKLRFQGPMQVTDEGYAYRDYVVQTDPKKFVKIDQD